MTRLSSVGHLGRQSLIYTGGNLLSKGIAFLLVPLYTQKLQPDEYGVLTLCLAVAAILLHVLSLGLGGAVSRLYVECKEEERGAFVTTVFISLMGFGGLATLLLYAFGPFLFDALFHEIPFDPYLRLTLTLAFLNLASVVPTALLRIQEKALSFVLVVYGNSVLKIALSVYFVVFAGRGLVGALEGILWANLLSLAGYVWAVWPSVSAAWSFPALSQSLKFSLPLVPHGLAHWMLNLSDRVILEWYVPLTDVGIYSLGYQISLIGVVVVTGISNAWTPFLINRYRQPKAQALFQRLTTYFAVCVIYVFLGIALLGENIIFLFAKPSYFQAAQVILPVALGHLWLGLYFVCMIYVFIAKKTQIIALASGAAAVVSVGLNLLLVPRFGFMAAAWNTMLAYLALFSLVFRYSRTLELARFEYRRILTALATALGLVALQKFLLPAEGIWGLSLKLVLMLGFPVLLYLGGFLQEAESEKLRSLIGSPRAGR